MIDRPERPGILRANASFLLAGAGLILLNVLSPYLVRFIRSAGFRLSGMGLVCLLDCIYYIPCVFLPACSYAVRKGGAGIRLGPVGFSQMLQCLAAAFLCVPLANSLSALWSMLLEAMGLALYSTEIPMNDASELMLAVFAVAVLPGICEELLFRGVVLGAYEKGGTRKAVLVSALLFSMLHGSVQGLPVQFIIGLILGLAVYMTDSLYTGMMIHTAYNAFILIFNYAVRGMETGEYTGMYEYLGGMQGVFTLLFECAVVLALLRLILKSFARQGYQSGVVSLPKAPLSMDGTEIIVLISGIVTVCFLYGEDILTLTGYLR